MVQVIAVKPVESSCSNSTLGLGLIAAFRTQRSRKHAGCVYYRFSKNLEDPTEICLAEKWESAELLKAHLEIVDEEFNTLLGVEKIIRAIAVSNKTSAHRILMEWQCRGLFKSSGSFDSLRSIFFARLLYFMAPARAVQGA